MKNPFMKYVMKEKKEDIFHSSEYGKAQSAETIGTASTESFEERMKVEKNRKIVQGYNDSRIVNGMYANGPKAKKYVPPEKKEILKGADSARSVGNKSVSAPTPTPIPAKRSFTPPIKPKFGV